MPFIERSAINAVISAEAVAERYNTFGMTDATTGKPVEVSAEAIRQGVDMSLMQSNPKEFRKQLNRAIFQNPTLSTVAIAGTAGQLTADIQKMQTAATGSTVDFTQQDFDALLRDSTDQRKQEIGRMLGIENMDAVRVEEFNRRKREFVENGGVDAYREQVKAARAMRKVKKESAAALPESLPANLSDGAHRFMSMGGTVDLGIYKDGDTYFVYDHKTRNVSKALSAEQVDDILKGQIADLAARASRSAKTTENAENEKQTDGKAEEIEDNKKDNAEQASSDENTIIVEIDSELAQRIENSKKSKYTVIKEYLIEKFYGKKITLSDGVTAIIDKRDAQHLSHKADSLRTAELSNLWQILKKAAFWQKVDKVKHDKFDAFRYYSFSVKYGADTFDMILNVGRAKNDGSYHVYDITKKQRAANRSSTDLARPVGHALKSSSSNNSIPQTTEKSNPSAKKYLYKDILMLARDQIADYKTLDAPGQSAVRMTLRQALAHGMSEQDALTYARVSAHTGIRVVFDKVALARDEDTQELVYADGFYNPRANEIVVNPEGKRSAEALLVHELTHAIYRTVDGRLILEREVRNLSEAEKQKITKRYAKVGQRSSLVLMDEMNAHYAEGLLANKNTLARLIDKKPTLPSRILSFFRSAKKDYAQDKRLSRSAEKLLRHYKTLFDNFSAQNRANLGLEAVRVEDGADEGVRFSIQDGKVVIDTDRDIFKGVDRKDYGRTVRTYMCLHFRGKQVNNALFTKRSEQEYTHSGYTQSLYGKEDGVYEAKMKASTELDKIVSAGTFLGHEDAKHPHEYNKGGYDRFEIVFNLDGEDFNGEMLIAIGEDDRRIFYDIVNIKRGDRTFTEELSAPIATASDNSITETERKSNPSDENSSEKNSEGRFALPEEGGVSLADSHAYTYDALVKKEDVSVVTFPTELPVTKKGEVDKNAVVARGRINARQQKNPNNTDERTYVHVGDIGLDVLLSKKGMVHGIARSQETAFAVMKIGDVLKNSVAVNELNGSAKRKTEMSYVLLGACRDSENLYVVRSVVSKLENDVTEIDVYQLGAVKGKKTETPTSALGGTGVKEQNALVSSESLAISIADLLQNVKDIPLANEVFSADVAKRLGVSRTKGSLSDGLRYALPSASDKIVMSRGQVQKQKANYASDRVFSKKEVTDALAGIPFLEYIPPDVREEWNSELWLGLNAHLDAGKRESFMELMSKRIVLEFEGSAISTEAYEVIQELKEEKTKERKATFKDTNGKSPDEREKLWEEYRQKAAAIDETIAAAYEDASQRLTEDWTREQKEKLAEDIQTQLNNLLEQGEKSVKAKLEEKFDASDAGKWKARYDEGAQRNKLLGQIAFSALRIRDLKLGKFANSTQADSDVFKKCIQDLSKIQFRGNVINAKAVRGYIADLSKWYTSKETKAMLGYGNGEMDSPDLWLQDIADKLEALAKGTIKEESVMKQISDIVEKALSQKGNIGEKYNQKQISHVPKKIADLVSRASDGKIDVSKKHIALNGDDIWHEYQNHNDSKQESGRGQVAFTQETMAEAIAALYAPDMVEAVFTDQNNPTQRQSFAYAKKSADGHYIVVEAIGGKYNPNIVPVMVLQFSESKWNDMMASGKTLGELFFEYDHKKLDALDIRFNKKNRVIAAQFASNEAIANTPHSPRFDDSISQTKENVNSNTFFESGSTIERGRLTSAAFYIPLLVQKSLDDDLLGLAFAHAEGHQFGQLIVVDLADGRLMDQLGIAVVGTDLGYRTNGCLVHNDRVALHVCAACRVTRYHRVEDLYGVVLGNAAGNHLRAGVRAVQDDLHVAVSCLVSMGH